MGVKPPAWMARKLRRLVHDDIVLIFPNQAPRGIHVGLDEVQGFS